MFDKHQHKDVCHSCDAIFQYMEKYQRMLVYLGSFIDIDRRTLTESMKPPHHTSGRNNVPMDTDGHSPHGRINTSSTELFDEEVKPRIVEFDALRELLSYAQFRKDDILRRILALMSHKRRVAMLSNIAEDETPHAALQEDPYLCVEAQDFAGSLYTLDHKSQVGDQGRKSSLEAFNMAVLNPSPQIRRDMLLLGHDLSTTFGEYKECEKSKICVMTVCLLSDYTRANFSLSQCNLDRLLTDIIPNVMPWVKRLWRSHDNPDYYASTGPLAALYAWNKRALEQRSSYVERLGYEVVIQTRDVNTIGGHGKDIVDAIFSTIKSTLTNAREAGTNFLNLRDIVDYLNIHGNDKGNRLFFEVKCEAGQQQKRKRDVTVHSENNQSLNALKMTTNSYDESNVSSMSMDTEATRSISVVDFLSLSSASASSDSSMGKESSVLQRSASSRQPQQLFTNKRLKGWCV